MFNTQKISNIILHVILITSAIGIVFFTVGIIIEKQVLTKQIQRITSKITDMVSNLPDSSKNQYRDIVNSIEIPNISDKDQQVLDKNTQIIENAFLTIGILLVAGFSAVLLLWYFSTAKSGIFQSFDIITLLKHNLVILVLAILTEIIFAVAILSQYYSTDSNMIIYGILNKLQVYGNSCSIF